MIEIDGLSVAIEPGDTLLHAARRVGVEVPTLCHDDRLAPTGCCRSCLVEIDGWRRLAPACATPAAAGMTVRTTSERVGRHRKALLALYLADQPLDVPNQVTELAQRVGAPADWFNLEPQREGRPDDANPYIAFQPELCISCARCTRYCAEVEAVSAITLAGRGSATTITTADRASLLDTTCELCGGCIATCPTGAMTEKLPLVQGVPAELPLRVVRTTCNYCGVGCQLDLNVDDQANDGGGAVVKVTSPAPGTPPNDGNLCVKGRFAYEFIGHADRLTEPMVRDEAGLLQRCSWDEALSRAAEGLQSVRKRRGSDALAFVSSSRCTVEENYLVQKLARAAFGTNNVHQCAAT